MNTANQTDSNHLDSGTSVTGGESIASRQQASVWSRGGTGRSQRGRNAKPLPVNEELSRELAHQMRTELHSRREERFLGSSTNTSNNSTETNTNTNTNTSTIADFISTERNQQPLQTTETSTRSRASSPFPALRVSKSVPSTPVRLNGISLSVAISTPVLPPVDQRPGVDEPVDNAQQGGVEDGAGGGADATEYADEDEMAITLSAAMASLEHRASFASEGV